MPAVASGPCDQLKFFTLHTAQQSAWGRQDMTQLYALNLEEAKYADACGHKESGSDRSRELETALTQYRNVGEVELGKQQYALARKHFLRSNVIGHELLAGGPIERADHIKGMMQGNDSDLAIIAKKLK